MTEQTPTMSIGHLLADYVRTPGVYDEYVHSTSGLPRDHVQPLLKSLSDIDTDAFGDITRCAMSYLRRRGVTFTLPGDGSDSSGERILPADLLPRLITPAEWEHLDRGLHQRVTALNLFITDIYSSNYIVRDRIIPEELIATSSGFIPELRGIAPPGGVHIHTAGIDLARKPDGKFVVLEDNLRVPSGVAYVLENRAMMRRWLPQLFEHIGVESVQDYPKRLAGELAKLVSWSDRPTIVLLTPGSANSAYFEHSLMARTMGIELVLPSHLYVDGDTVFLRSLPRPRRVDAVYRRVDDEFLDPSVLRRDSLVGVPGLLQAYASGRIVLANSPGNGVADDKAVYAYVPDFIRYYLGEEPIIPNVPTYLLWDDDQRADVLSRLDQLVIKPVAEAGGYGIVIGPAASDEELETCRRQIVDDPRNYIAQEVVALSRHPSLCDDHLEGRHIDLRPFVLSGDDIEVIPGGLTRVAMRKGSLVVNSSQGGGSKDTWVLAPRPDGDDADETDHIVEAQS